MTLGWTYWKGAKPAAVPAAVGTKLWANCWMSSLRSRFQNSCPGLYRLWSSYEWGAVLPEWKIRSKTRIHDEPWQDNTHRNEEWNVKRRFFQGSMNWLTIWSKEKHRMFVVRKKSCSKAGRRHLWRFVSVDKFLSGKRQVGRTWCGQLMTGFWQIFELSK